MGWFTGSSSSRPGYARSYAGSSYSSRSRHGHSSSYYKRRPRDGYIQYLIYKFKHFLRELYYYARRHPYKVFFMVIMPLVSSGVLYKVARQFNINLPDFLRGNAVGGHGARGGGPGGYYGSQGYDYEYKREQSGIGSLANNIGNVASLAKMAQSFM